jgi:DNA transformation protein
MPPRRPRPAAAGHPTASRATGEARRAPTRPSADDAALAALARLRNLGPASARMLLDAGIRDEATLRTMGAAAAFRRVLFARGGGGSANLLWALEGALTDTRWDQLSGETRARLRAEVEQG